MCDGCQQTIYSEQEWNIGLDKGTKRLEGAYEKVEEPTACFT
jgi:hypothetical protein